MKLTNTKLSRSLILIIALTLVLFVVLSSCQSAPYYDMDSVYAYAKEVGYTGTLEEFVALVSGKDGKDGLTITSFEKTASAGLVDTYTITYSDGTSSSFSVTNGKDSKAEARGYSNYELWLTLDGNAGKTLTEYFDSLRGSNGTNGSSITAIETATNFSIGSTLSIISSFNTEYGATASAGSGIVYAEADVDSNGASDTVYLITNYHVVYCDVISNGWMSYPVSQISDNIRIYLYGMNYSSAANYGIPATFVGGSYNSDIAVLALRGDSYTAYKNYQAKCGKVSDAPAAEYFIRPVTESAKSIGVGNAAIAIGNPEGKGLAATSGVVSVDSENISINIYLDTTSATPSYITSKIRVMRIDTAVNSGNSGGGLFNASGEWIGIVNAKVSDTSIENISYAIPHELASAIADNIISSHKEQLTDASADNDNNQVIVKKAMLGVNVKQTDSYATVVNGTPVIISENKIDSIVEGGLASTLTGDNALAVGDIMLSANLGGTDIELERYYELGELLYGVKEPTTLYLTILRAGLEKTVTIEITANDIQSIG